MCLCYVQMEIDETRQSVIEDVCTVRVVCFRNRDSVVTRGMTKARQETKA